MSLDGMDSFASRKVTGMFDRSDVDAIERLARKARAQPLRPGEKGELRALLAKYSPRAHDLAGADLLPVALFFLGVATLAEGGLAAASAS